MDIYAGIRSAKIMIFVDLWIVPLLCQDFARLMPGWCNNDARWMLGYDASNIHFTKCKVQFLLFLGLFNLSITLFTRSDTLSFNCN